MNRFSYLEAKSWLEASSALQQDAEQSLAKAAGVDVWDRLKEGLDSPRRLVSLLHIPGGETIEVERDGAVRIGALATLADIASHPELESRSKALAKAAGTAANPNVREQATLGGNLGQHPRCVYFRSREHDCLRKGGSVCFAQRGEHRMHAVFDNRACAAVLPSSLAVALVAARAEVGTVRGTSEEVRFRPVESLFVPSSQSVESALALEPGELIHSVRLPPADGWVDAYAKARVRRSVDWPIVEVAVGWKRRAGKIESARIVLGAVAMTPWRASEAERALVGTKAARADVERAVSSVMVGATPLPNNAYKLSVAEAVTAEAIAELEKG